ncbi:MAG TPA: hypothetical protein VFB02_20170 [Bradyrhizobium sp.]|nr:hypothetical protein [Bradyrhizobium sp.]
MGQKSEPSGCEQVYVLGLDDHGNPRGARFTMLEDSIVSAAMDLKCRVLIRQPDAVSKLGMKLPLGHVVRSGTTVKLLIPNIGRELYNDILEASRLEEAQEKARIAAAISMTVH